MGAGDGGWGHGVNMLGEQGAWHGGAVGWAGEKGMMMTMMMMMYGQSERARGREKGSPVPSVPANSDVLGHGQ
jgi:hypothetical protein